MNTILEYRLLKYWNRTGFSYRFGIVIFSESPETDSSSICMNSAISPSFYFCRTIIYKKGENFIKFNTQSYFNGSPARMDKAALVMLKKKKQIDLKKKYF